MLAVPLIMVAKLRNQPGYPSANEGMKKTKCVSTIQCYLALLRPFFLSTPFFLLTLMLKSMFKIMCLPNKAQLCVTVASPEVLFCNKLGNSPSLEWRSLQASGLCRWQCGAASPAHDPRPMAIQQASVWASYPATTRLGFYSHVFLLSLKMLAIPPSPLDSHSASRRTETRDFYPLFSGWQPSYGPITRRICPPVALTLALPKLCTWSHLLCKAVW